MWWPAAPALLCKPQQAEQHQHGQAKGSEAEGTADVLQLPCARLQVVELRIGAFGVWAVQGLSGLMPAGVIEQQMLRCRAGHCADRPLIG